MEPYFSVILPIYNVAPYLERCVRSVLAQSFRDFELILVDDGSTDGSPGLCDVLAARDARIRVIHKSNGGLASARNAGTELARGRYIWWVDSDDWIAEGALECLHSIAEEDSPDMVKFRYIRVTDHQRLVSSCIPAGLYGREDKNRLMDKAFSGSSFSLSACMHIYRRTFLEGHALSFVSERLVASEDYRFNLEALLLAESVRVIEDALYYYELRGGSLTQGYRQNLFERYTLLYRQLEERYQCLGAPAKYRDSLRNYYVMYLFRNVCLGNEYRDIGDHTTAQGRRNVRSYLGSQDLRQALRHCSGSGLPLGRRVQLLAMKLGWEPLFYWLYVEKPRLVKGPAK